MSIMHNSGHFKYGQLHLRLKYPGYETTTRGNAWYRRVGVVLSCTDSASPKLFTEQGDKERKETSTTTWKALCKGREHNLFLSSDSVCELVLCRYIRSGPHDTSFGSPNPRFPFTPHTLTIFFFIKNANVLRVIACLQNTTPNLAATSEWSWLRGAKHSRDVVMT